MNISLMKKCQSHVTFITYKTKLHIYFIFVTVQDIHLKLMLPIYLLKFQEPLIYTIYLIIFCKRILNN